MNTKSLLIASILIIFFSILLPAQQKGEFIDVRDNTNYKWIIIGEQKWMAENLTYLPKVYPSKMGSAFMDNNCLPYQYVYNYEGENEEEAKDCESFVNQGVLYNYTAAKNACPDGWRLPTLEDWRFLFRALGMPENVINNDHFIYEGSVGEKLQKIEKYGNDNLGENEYGFNAKLGGLRFHGNVFVSKDTTGFDLQGHCAFFWTSTINVPNQSAYRITLERSSKGVMVLPMVLMNGLSVRCIQE